MSSRDSKHSDDLKDAIQGIETLEKASTSSIDANYDPSFVRKTIRMVDWRMLPLLGLLYSVALIDRINLGVARTAGMQEDLKLQVGNRYSIASMIYFFPYMLLQIPGNLILRSIGPRNLLTICVVGWGIAQLGMAFVKTWGFLCLCRIFLGAFESVFFPSLVFIITTWYKRYEVQQRLAVFYLSSIAISSFSSVLAYAISLLAGKANLNGWRWIFLLEGALTICLGVLAWFFVPDFPDKSKWLTVEQRKMILDRVEADRGDSVPDELTRAKFFSHLKDPLLWAFGLMFLASTVPAYAIAFFITIILKAMGFSTAQALLLTAPPGIWAAISCFFFAWLSDKTKHRAGWMVVQNMITITGLAIAAYAISNPVRYFGLFLVYGGATGCIPGVLAYSSNNITTHTKRAVHTASIVLWGGVGGIMATTVFREQDFPRYVNGMWATIGLQLMMIVLLGITTFVFKRRNRLRREGKIGPLEGQEDFYYTI
ncbi:high-affinity nicotinic acid transporter [Pholiota conissans]|uniref:High-affinity nicotinic acid transporter n=1 Tax=Pholiota conissans TaxID=109636 RepID=A0A9P6D479_9AGAR|nr:high-affinity nicotinic acid transporter [Pholiota conissans]